MFCIVLKIFCIFVYTCVSFEQKYCQETALTFGMQALSLLLAFPPTLSRLACRESLGSNMYVLLSARVCVCVCVCVYLAVVVYVPN